MPVVIYLFNLCLLYGFILFGFKIQLVLRLFDLDIRRYGHSLVMKAVFSSLIEPHDLTVDHGIWFGLSVD